MRLPMATADRGGKYNSCCGGKARSSRAASRIRGTRPYALPTPETCSGSAVRRHNPCRLRPQQPQYLRNSSDLSHYIGMSQTIDNADLPEPPFSEVAGTIRPFSLVGTAPDEVLVAEAGRHHSPGPAKRQGDATDRRAGPRPARVPHQRASGGQSTSFQSQVPTIYDPAIAETDAAFRHQRRPVAVRPAVEHGALLGTQSRTPQREPGRLTAGVSPAELNQDVAVFDTTLSKTTADGTVLSLSNSTVI